MATNKEAIVFVLDCGPNVNDSPAGSPTFLQESLRCIQLILQRKIFSESKDEVSLVTFGTDETDNPLDDGRGEYGNIAVKRELRVTNLEFMKLLEEIGPGEVAGDFVDALIVAADHLKTETDGQKISQKQIYLFTNFGAPTSTDKLNTVAKAMKNSGFMLTVIGYDLEDDDDDVDSSGQFKSRTNIQRKNERIIKQIMEQLDGSSFSFQEADSMLNFFKKRTLRSMPWKVNLELGTSLKIPVCLYLKIKKFSPKSWKKSYGEDPTAKLQNERSYHKMDEAQTECDKEKTVEAYRFGKSLVPFSLEDKKNMAYESGSKNFAILAFAKQEGIKRHHYLGDCVYYVVPNTAFPEAVVALSAFIHAMYETGMVAIVRYVYSARSSPKIGFIAPIIKADYECLSFIQLPFMEDLRLYTFASLDVNPKNVPSKEQLDAMDELITNMDLTKKDGKGKTKEMLAPKSITNPSIQRLYQCMLHRGLNPKEPIPKPDDRLTKNFTPDPKILEACKVTSEKIAALFPLKVIEVKKDKQTGAALFENKAKSDDGDVGTTLNNGMAFRGTVKEVGTTNPKDDFLDLIKNNPQEKDKYCEQLQKVILRLVMDSFGLISQENYQKALDCIKELRKEAITTSPNNFNKFMEDFKSDLFSKGKLEFWDKLCAEKIGLLTKEESVLSHLATDEADKFFVKKVEDIPPSSNAEDEEMNDLLEDM